MQKLYILAVWGLLSIPLFGQYTRFNEVQLLTANLGLLPYGSFEFENVYFTYSFNSPNFFCLHNTLQGETVSISSFNTNFDFLGAAGVGGMITKSTNTNNYIFCPITMYNSCGYAYLGLVKFQGYEYVAAFQYNELNGTCDENKEHIPTCIFNINDTTIATVSNYRDYIIGSLGFLIENNLGYRLNTFNLDGELLESYLQITPDDPNGPTLTPVFFTCTKREDHIIATGQDTSPFVLKMDMQGNILDSLHFGLTENRTNSGSGTMINDSTFQFIYSQATEYMQSNSQPILYTIRVAQIDLNDFTIIQDQAINFLESDQPQFAYQFGKSILNTNQQMVTCGGLLHESDWLTQESFVCAIDSDGETSWQFFYSPEVIDTIYNFNDIILTSDGGYLLTGQTGDEYPQLNTHTWLLKLDACGYEEPSDCPPVVGVSNSAEVPSFNAWPNPFRSQLKAQLPANANHVDWLDATGRLVHSEKVYYPYQEWNLGALPIGVYHMQVILEDGRVASKKVVKD
jgi:hypothetical protein